MKIILLALIFSATSYADDAPQIQVQGRCEIKVTPDRGKIVFTAENQSRDQKEAVKKTTLQINQLKTESEKLKLENLELKNTNYSVFPVREYEKEKVVDKGFRAQLSLEVVTSEINKIGEAMAAASKAGITNVGSLESFLSHEKSKEEYSKCLDIAADDARSKAEKLAKKLGFKIGNVVNLIESQERQAPVFPERTMMKAMDSGSTQVEAGTQNFVTNIQVTFAIR
jgi:uncharacterized protein YggE